MTEPQDSTDYDVPDIVDVLGRTWTYKAGTRGIYVHDSMAWTRDMIERPDLGWPTGAVLDNPNYQLCDACRAGAQTNAHLAHARYLGADAALAAASWVTMDESDARSILDDVDPEVMDRYPEPTLSSWEVACDETLGMMLDVERATDAMADAWEEGRDAVWSSALGATAHRVLGDIPAALELERTNEAYVDELRSHLS